jgi:hypothetical protein
MTLCKILLWLGEAEARNYRPSVKNYNVEFEISLFSGLDADNRTQTDRRIDIHNLRIRFYFPAL